MRFAHILLLLAALSLASCTTYKLTVAYSRERDSITGRSKEQIGAALTLEDRKESTP